MEERTRLRDLASEVLRRLEARWGSATQPARRDPLGELVACILSQHTSDVNSHRAFERLRRKYACYSDAMTAPVEELADTIRVGGLANTKADKIQGCLRAINADRGALTLDFLEELSDQEARAYLMELPGVGPKTAAIVLCFALGRPVLPVDTHVFRVAWRLGLVERRIGEARAHSVLEPIIPAEYVYRFHVALITHGRRICRAISPRCAECPLTDLCRYFREQQVP